MIGNFDQIFSVLRLFYCEALPFPEEVDDCCVSIFGGSVKGSVTL